jgi:hypothetical protein
LSGFQPPHAKKKEGDLQHARTGLRLLKTTLQVGHSLSSHNPEKAVQQLVVAGLKMASDNLFYQETANPLKLVEELKKLGIGALAWAPETLMAAIDRKYGGWSEDQVAEALEHFQKTGVIKTQVPQLVREKLYAIRVVCTSNSAQTEWHIFEKVGGAFNDRIAHFGTLEPLSAAECARTVAIIENLRPDTYEDEIKCYIGASCHMDGLYTADPVKWIRMAETYLQQMNFETTGEHIDLALRTQIESRLADYVASKTTIREVPEDLVSVQATKLLGIKEYAEEILV